MLYRVLGGVLGGSGMLGGWSARHEDTTAEIFIDTTFSVLVCGSSQNNPYIILNRLNRLNWDP